MKKALSFILVATLFCINAPLAIADIVEGIIGTINNEVFTVQDLIKLFPYYGIKLEKSENRLDYILKKEEALKKTWEKLVEEKVLEFETQRLGIEVKKEDINRVIDEIKKQQGIKDEEFLKKLEDEGFSLEGYKRYLKIQISKAKIIEAIIKPRVHIDERQLMSFFESNKEKYTEPQSICLLQIFISSKGGKSDIEKKVEIILNRILQGEDFFVLAKQFSDIPSEIDLGCLSAEEMAPTLWEDLESVQVGQPYVLETEDGIFVFLVSRKEEARPLSFEEVRKRVFEDFYKEKVEEEYRKWLDEAKKRLRVCELL